jgi:two-component system nitrogen regulation response regulator NtrX
VSKKILIVDDEPGIRKSLSGPLSREGYEVETASGFADAVGANDGEFDLLLLDVCLPDGDGVELLERFVREFPDQITVMMSGHSTIETAVRAVKVGAFDFLEKPLSLEKVLVTVENALRYRQLRSDHARLKSVVEERYQLVGNSDALKDVRSRIEAAAATGTRVLIRGESGTGKEVVARQIHHTGIRASGSFIPVNCAAIPEELMESELFGHKRGAFTGAASTRVGKFEEADGGTIFLDEIGDMSSRAQAKVLRVLEDGEIERLGGGRRKVDARVIAATNRNIEKLIQDGKFREDLFFRINVFPIDIPPLRDRPDDIPDLALHFVERVCSEYGRRPPRLLKPAARALMKMRFPGNARELRNLIERVLITNQFSDISLEAVEQARGRSIHSPSARRKLKEATAEFERQLIETVIEEVGDNMTEAANRLGLERSHLYKKMKSLGMRESDN